ncbi:MAG TPA: NADH-quinone oxidoreductase subunit L [Turneriella sp.]|nr:NADH-quinone oxidoreductase subunit L [Turneriella sp.]HNL10511.1 NADH-quinone oxidoreductase subunit L [Turneriella sp.]
MKPEHIPYLLIVVPLAPLLAAVINTAIFAWTERTKKVTAQAWTIFITLSLTLLAGGAHAAVIHLHPSLNGEGTATIVSPATWMALVHPLRLSWAIRFDALTTIMVPVVLFVGLMVQIFSVGYFHDRRQDIARYYAWLSFFLFSMLLLVVSANMFVFFVGWEAVGLSSYKLISFYLEKDTAQKAGKKAFIMNRIGDAALLIAMFALFRVAGSADFREIALAFSRGSIAHSHANFIGLMVFIAASAKSAQIPLYTWLPDAMTGPTPVSALIHAATMVTAGIFLMLRLEPVFALAPEASALVAYAGAGTALLAAFVAVGQTDIKKVLAFSTVSQLGLMVLAVGTGAYAAAFFHLFTHAFFKAMLFLSAGAVITYLHHEQNIRKMGGLMRAHPLLGILFWVALAALAGIPGLSGFFSKDHILAAAFAAKQNGNLLGSVVVIVSLLTAFYSFRLGILVFHGKAQAHDSGHESHELPTVSFNLPLVLLAIPAVIAGFAGIPAFFTGNEPLFFEFLNRNFPAAVYDVTQQMQWKLDHAAELRIITAGVAAALTGSLAAIFWYGILRRRPVAEGAYRNGLVRASLRKLYIDEIYDFCFVKPYRAVADKLARWDATILPAVSEGIGLFVAEVSGMIARLQTGVIAHYFTWIFAGIVVFLTLAMGIL